MNNKRTRIAPTPSGFLHLGNVMSFALTAFLAKRSGAEILLRIDDMDRERMQEEYVQDIFDTMDFLHIPWHKGPRNIREFETGFSQLHRLSLYNEALEQLKEQRLVFACTCSRSQLAAENNDGPYPGTCRNKNIPLGTSGVAWRLYTDDRLLAVNTIDEKLEKKSLPTSMKDFIVRKKDGFPAYQLTSLVDDLYWKIGLVVRGEDLWASTLAQLYLAEVMDRHLFKQTRFYHHSLLTSAKGSKLSKSAGDTSVRFLRQKGSTAADIFRMIALMQGLHEPADDWYSLGKLFYEAPQACPNEDSVG